LALRISPFQEAALSPTLQASYTAKVHPILRSLTLRSTEDLHFQLPSPKWKKSKLTIPKIGCFFLGKISYSAYNITYGQTNSAFHFNLTSLDEKLTFREVLDRGFLLDGIPYMNALDHDPLGPITVPRGFPFGDIFSFAFCQETAPGILPQLLIWDPQLSALFDVPRAPTPGEPPSAASVGKKVPLGAILGSVFGVLGLLAIIVIVYVNSPKLQAIIQPYKTAHSARDEKTIASRWQAVRAPTTPSP
jgi:hypothetical protein